MLINPILKGLHLPGILAGRLYGVSLILLVTLVIGALLRTALLLRPDSATLGWQEILPAFASGALFDSITALYLTLPLVLLLCLLPSRWLAGRSGRRLAIAGLNAALYAGFCLLILVTVSEWVFWDEFGARFNFIAVDYLVYTHEVLGNIRESYPVGRILAGLAVLALLCLLPFVRSLARRLQQPVTGRERLATAAAAVLIAAGCTAFLSSDNRPEFDQDLAQELSGNGIYQFFSALRRSSLDYPRFFATLPQAEATRLMQAPLVSAGEHWPAEPYSELERLVVDERPERRLNVVMVSIESMGSEFIGALGDTRKLTPNLDRLAAQSLFFTNAYATGNRTVRGLEALSLSIPPTPGESIVKRPGANHLFTLGSVFEDRGYDSVFLYGGYGYFDNMAGFFSGNDYRVIDRRQIADEKVHYQNIWGVADEDLFDRTLEELDGIHGSGKPFFAHVMTTTNHRPYTYPEGRIDIPSGTGREGAVKYTDHAIGRFMDMASRRPWFRDTVFVLTADHGAGARGTMDIPTELYRVPILIHSPAHIRPERVDRLMSQIDVAPTLLGQLHMSYRTKFFGHDILRAAKADDRAFVATYQTLGYIREGQLVSLSPHRKVRVQPLNPGGATASADQEKRLTAEAVAWYQTAYHIYKSHQYDDDESNDKPALKETSSAGGQPARPVPPPSKLAAGSVAAR